MSLFSSRRDPAGREAPVRAGSEEAPARVQTSRDDTASSEGGPMASIGKSIVFKGDLSGDEDLQIDGQVEGGIQLANHQLTIGETGRVQAQLYAKSVIVVGQVIGNITATERVEIQVNGVVEGDIHSPRLVVADGAVLNGTIEMTSAQKNAPAAAPAKADGEGGDAVPPDPSEGRKSVPSGPRRKLLTGWGK